jgi:hypothetical protein
MKRKSILAAGAIVAVLAGVASAQANNGGGSDGATGVAGQGALSFFNNNRPDNRINHVLVANPEPSGWTTLPGGTHMQLDGHKVDRRVVIDSPNYGRFQGKLIKTTFNPDTGITSVWLRNPDGTRTGIHTDSLGNQMVSEHRR